MMDKYKIINKIKSNLLNGDIVMRLIFVNVVFYIIGNIFNFIGLMFGFLAFDMADIFSKKWLFVPSIWNEFISIPYTLISYQFLHSGFFHLVSNLFIIYYFGGIFTKLTFQKKLLPLYVLGGIFSGVLFLVAYNFIPFLEGQSYRLVGASGSAMAILAAVATLIPNQKIYLFGQFKVKYKWIAFFFLGINILGLSAPNATGNYAHIGGLLFGYIFIQSRYDLAKPFNDLLSQMLSFLDFKEKPKFTVINNKFKDKKIFQSKKPNRADQNKIDAILDKISHSGYEKLTDAEKKFLFNHSGG